MPYKLEVVESSPGVWETKEIYLEYDPSFPDEITYGPPERYKREKEITMPFSDERVVVEEYAWRKKRYHAWIEDDGHKYGKYSWVSVEHDESDSTVFR